MSLLNNSRSVKTANLSSGSSNPLCILPTMIWSCPSSTAPFEITLLMSKSAKVCSTFCARFASSTKTITVAPCFFQRSVSTFTIGICEKNCVMVRVVIGWIASSASLPSPFWKMAKYVLESGLSFNTFRPSWTSDNPEAIAPVSIWCVFQ